MTFEYNRLPWIVNAFLDMNLYWKAQVPRDDPLTYHSSSKTNVLPYVVFMSGNNIKKIRSPLQSLVVFDIRRTVGDLLRQP